jgi:CRISPR-associated protein Csb1
MVAEIVGIGAVYGVKTSSRIDPLRIVKEGILLYNCADDIGWTQDASLADKDNKGVPIKVGKEKEGKPSDVNHSNVTPDLKDKKKKPHPGGVTITHAEQSIVLSLPALRRLRFPVDGDYDPARDNAARAVLAALGLCAAALAAETGLDLRSRCLLWPEAPLTWELLGKPGEPPTEFTLDADTAIGLLDETVKRAKALGLPWREEPVVLTPSDTLVKLVVKSQQLAIQKGDLGQGDD